MAELSLLHEAVVGEDEIDELGHMNVRFYAVKAAAGAAELLARLGLSEDACRGLGARVDHYDLYTRHVAEQLVGARLAVRGGVLDLRPDGLRMYLELVNPSRGELSAAFVQHFVLRDAATGAPATLPEAVAAAARGTRVEWPAHGRPRTVDLDREPAKPSLALLRERGLAQRKAREVGADECLADGRFDATKFPSLLWGGEPVEPGESQSWLLDLEDGGKMGWATLESRGILHRIPRRGTRIQSFSATVELAAKTFYEHGWVWDLDAGDLLCTCSVVNLAFDIGARRATEIPRSFRARLEHGLYPDLA